MEFAIPNSQLVIHNSATRNQSQCIDSQIPSLPTKLNPKKAHSKDFVIGTLFTNLSNRDFPLAFQKSFFIEIFMRVGAQIQLSKVINMIGWRGTNIESLPT